MEPLDNLHKLELLSLEDPRDLLTLLDRLDLLGPLNPVDLLDLLDPLDLPYLLHFLSWTFPVALLQNQLSLKVGLLKDLQKLLKQ